MTAQAYREKRLEMGLSIEQLAATLKISEANIRRRESGEVPISVEAELALISLQRLGRGHRRTSGPPRSSH